MAELVRYDAMCRAIDAAYAVDEVKDIRDKALAIEIYSRQAMNIEAERQAVAIRLRAERRAGQLIRQMEKAKGTRGQLAGPLMTRGPEENRTLRDLGISYDQSSRWQQLADVPEGDFEAALTAPEMPTTSGIIRKARDAAEKPKVIPVAPEALWIWGRLRDFERGDPFDPPMLQQDPSEVMATATKEMKADVARLGPLVAAWLEKASQHERREQSRTRAS